MSEPLAESPLEVRYQITAEDWPTLERRLRRDHRFAAAWGRFLVVGAYLLACCLPGFVILVLLGKLEALAVAGVLYLIAYVALLWKTKATPPDMRFFVPVTVTLRPEYLESTSELGGGRDDWRRIERLDYTEELLTFWSEEGVLHFAPRRAFSSAEAAKTFYEAARRFREHAPQSPLGDRPAFWQNPDALPSAQAKNALTVSFSISPRQQEELAAAGFRVVGQEPAPPKPANASRWLWVAILPIVLIVCFGGWLVDALLAPLFLFLFVSGLMLWPVTLLQRALLLRRLSAKPRPSFTVAISAAGISSWSPGREGHTYWRMIDEVHENDHAIAFCAKRPNPFHVHVIPKSAFPDEHAARRFADSAAQYVAAKTAEVEPPPREPKALETGNPYQPPQPW
jgi:hypothetical protein